MSYLLRLRSDVFILRTSLTNDIMYSGKNVSYRHVWIFNPERLGSVD